MSLYSFISNAAGIGCQNSDHLKWGTVSSSSLSPRILSTFSKGFSWSFPHATLISTDWWIQIHVTIHKHKWKLSMSRIDRQRNKTLDSRARGILQNQSGRLVMEGWATHYPLKSASVGESCWTAKCWLQTQSTLHFKGQNEAACTRPSNVLKRTFSTWNALADWLWSIWREWVMSWPIKRINTLEIGDIH